MHTNRLQHFLETGERLLALALFVTVLPLLGLLALLIKLTSRGPVIFTQVRVGLNGRLFTLYKLRTMYHNCEHTSGPRWSSPDDPRVTLLGRFLRASHLDELPQLINVIRGDMSLVGPRPERPEFVTVLAELLPNYTGRLHAKPGITGLAQIQLPPDTDLASVQKKLACDLYYVQNRNLWLDVRILIATILRSLGVPTRQFLRLLRLPPWYAISQDTASVAQAAPPRATCSTPKPCTPETLFSYMRSARTPNSGWRLGSSRRDNCVLDERRKASNGSVC